MGLLRKAVIVATLGIAIKYFISCRQNQPPPNFGGHVEPGFEAVEHAFRQNFETGFESDGAAFAAYHRGKLVVDLWGGYADKSALRPWKQETVSMVYSTTKAATAVVIAVLVDRGLLSYEDPIVKYWPEFGKHGKDKITIKMLMAHQAGLAAVDEPVSLEVVQDWRKMSKVFENQVPLWTPGTAMGYHAFTFGWLCDQLVRRVDPQHRSLGQFFKEEIAKKFDIDFFIGLPREELHRMARMTVAGLWDLLIRMGDWDFVKDILPYFIPLRKNPILDRVMANPDWMKDVSNERCLYNNYDFQALEIPAANGIGTARGLARLLYLFDGSDLISKDLFKKIYQPAVVSQEDKVLNKNLTFEWGFLFTKSPDGNLQIGHSGYGGQNVKFNPHEHLAFAYLRNNMAPDMDEFSRTMQNLQRALYDSVKALKSNK